MRVTAHDLATNKVLLGLDGTILENTNHIRRFITVAGRFKTYKLIPWPHSPKGAHTIDLEEVAEWNDAIKNSLLDKKEAFKYVKAYDGTKSSGTKKEEKQENV